MQYIVLLFIQIYFFFSIGFSPITIPPIHLDHTPIHKRIIQAETNRISYLINRSKTMKSRLGTDVPADFLGFVFLPFGLDKTGGNGINRSAGAFEEFHEVAREGVNGTLADAIGQGSAVGMDAHLRTDENNATVPGNAVEQVAQQEDGSADIDVEHTLPLGIGEVLKTFAEGDAGIEHQAIDAGALTQTGH